MRVNGDAITLSLMNRIRSPRLTPAFSPTTSTSARTLVSDASTALVHSLTTRASCPAPTRWVDGPIRSSRGCTRRTACCSPETTRVSFPARTTFGLPLTGAHTKAVPAPRAATAARSEARTETVEQSTHTLGGVADFSGPSAESTSASRASSLASMLNITGAVASAPLRRIVAPEVLSDSSRHGDRFHTCTGTSAASRRSTIGSPIRP